MTDTLPGLPGHIDKRTLLKFARRTDFSFFCMKAVRELVPKFEDNWHLRAFYAFGEKIVQGEILRGMVNVAPRALKSVVFASLLPAFLLGQDPKCKVICVSYSADLAEQLAADTRKIMQSSWYRELFPNTRLSRTALDRLVTTAGGMRMATSIGGSVTGFGADVIIIDDPLKADDAYSEAMRTRANHWIRSSLMSRLNDRRTGRVLVVAQRVHEFDVCGMLLESGGWEVLSLPAVATEAVTYDIGHRRTYTTQVGELLHESRLSLEHLNQLRADIGSRNVEAQYQQRPTPADGSIFKRKWLKFSNEPWIRLPGDRIIQSWDMANKAGEANDWSVCVTAVRRRSQIIVIDVFRDRLAFPDLKKKVISHASLYRPGRLLIEDAAAGTQMIQSLQNEQPRGVPLPIAIKADRDKLVRADRAAARVESGALVLPAKASWLDPLVDEMLAFPGGRYDDQVDALTQLLIHTEEQGTLPGMAPPSVDHTTMLEPQDDWPSEPQYV